MSEVETSIDQLQKNLFPNPNLGDHRTLLLDIAHLFGVFPLQRPSDSKFEMDLTAQIWDMWCFFFAENQG